MQLILASASPRRRELLSMLEVPFSLRESMVDERALEAGLAGAAPAEKAMKTAEAKALSAAEGLAGPAVIIGADTIVAYDGELLHKPADKDAAFATLSRLSGHTHMVYTGVCLAEVLPGKAPIPHSFVAGTRVTFRSLTEKEILAYIATGEPFDKAGAYGIQGKGALLVSRIEGDFFNVVGLPLTELHLRLRALGLDIPSFWESTEKKS
ncbi:septum formation protein Maf [Anaerotignum lactatifermentans]|uniref:dTTP/UTP pyrophosphatase n=1 Tax=Anaerotignum lactatifermentans TaxID=160404 RepID=A0ABS2G9S4_9FIRM|nr:Maf family protein [Anaerotignum lactatifermentans]MBM6829031.1 septum formation protein Maf [Anaerotignum lactatifermentans]MBM6877362.1 septum formation protein Maf [Anaerotignum lactatifermentans]MBM6950732.1 septum formation protein Maf [Anaerotignum lactatifermentans]